MSERDRLNRQIIVGVAWNVVGLLLQRGSTLITTLILARLLAPEVFGLIAMVTICFELANVIVQSGLGQALIRSEKINQADLDTVFMSNLGLSVIAYVLLFLGAPWIAQFYDQQALTKLVRVVGLVVFTNAFRIVHVAILSREMNFRAQTQANVFAALVSGLVAIALAWLGFGVWSLVVQILLASAMTASVLWVQSGWRPQWKFNTSSFRRMFGFGSNLLAMGLLEVLHQNIYVLIIGKVFSAELTGFYFLAKRLTSLISQQTTNSAQQALFPALAKLQGDDALLLTRYRQAVQMMMFVLSPIMILMAALAQPMVLALFGDKWRGAASIIAILCFAGAIYPLHALNVNILKVKGRSDLVLKIGVVKKAVSIALLFAAIPYGVLAIAGSQVLSSVVALVPNNYYAAKLISYDLRTQLVDAFAPVGVAMAAALAAAGFVFTFGLGLGPLPSLFLGGAIGGGLYLLIGRAVGLKGLALLLSRVGGRVRKAAPTGVHPPAPDMRAE